MHLYRTIKAPEIFKPVKITENSYFTKKHHNKYLRISQVITLTLTPELPEDFYCKIRVFEGGQLQVATENCICKGLEGTFVEENQTCEIIRLENGDFELIRERPVNVDNFTRIGSIDTAAGFSRLPSFFEGKLRLMNGGAILQEWPVSASAEIGDMAEFNPNGDNLSVYSSSKISYTTGAASWLTEAFFDMWDFSRPPTVLIFTKLKYVQGVGTLPVAPLAHFYGNTCAVNKNIMENSPQSVLHVDTGIQNESGIYDDIIIEANQNVVEINCENVYDVSNYNLTIKDCPNLEKIYFNSNKVGNCIDSMVFSNCPKVNYLHLGHFYATYGSQYAPDKNGDQIMIDLDNNGLLNGTVYMSKDWKFTASSDAARANLAGKNWALDLKSFV